MRFRIAALLVSLSMVPLGASAQQATADAGPYECAVFRGYTSPPTDAYVDIRACSAAARSVHTDVPPAKAPEIGDSAFSSTCVSVQGYSPNYGYERWCGRLATGIVVDPLLDSADVNFNVLGQYGSTISVNLHFTGSGDRNPLVVNGQSLYGLPPNGPSVFVLGAAQMHRFADVSGFVTTSGGLGGTIDRPAPAGVLVTSVIALASVY